MKTFIKILGVIFVVFLFTGCDKKQVPPGYSAKLLTEQGYTPEVYHTGWVTVCSVFDLNCKKELIFLETSEGQFTEKVTIRMKDNMNLVADYVRIRVKINTDKKNINSVFNLIKPDKNGYITLSNVYKTYGNLIVVRDIREVLSKYTIDDVRLNYSKITAEIYSKIKKDFESTPILVLDFNLGRLNYPKVYDEAIILAKKKELEIKKIEADNIIKLKKINAKQEIAKAEYNIKMQEAKRIRDYNKMISEGVSPQLIKLRQLEVQQSMVDAIKGNPNVIYMPYGMMEGNMLLQIPNKNK
jgi:hypothetical protein